MNEQMKNLVFLLIGIAVVLLVVIILFSGKSRFMKFLSLFLEEKTDGDDVVESPAGGRSVQSDSSGGRAGGRAADDTQKKTNEIMVEMATLTRKSDDRLRVIESTGQVKLIDEYYELVFITRKGRTLKIECSRDAYDKVPFNQQGSLTYKRNKLIKFKYYDDIVYNNSSDKDK